MPIFVDEAGFTGNDLLNYEQPFFALSSILISETESASIVDRVKSNFRIQAAELKTKNLLKTSKGKDAIQYILHNLNGRYAVSCNHKGYNLCCKFFEYIFEPVLQKNNFLFYKKNFHRFIANSLYLFSLNEDKSPIDLLVNFSKFMKEKDFDSIERLFSSKTENEETSKEFFEQIIDFVRGYNDLIIEEIEQLKMISNTGKWILDLSYSSLWSLMRHWNNKIGELTIFCDPSKPLSDLVSTLDIMVGNKERIFLEHPSGKKYCPIINLKEPIKFVDSNLSPSIQLADIIAGAAVYTLKTGDPAFLNIINQANIEESVFPTLQHTNLAEKEPFINAIVLKELADRAKNDLCPLTGMAEYYEIMEATYDINPPSLAKT